MGEAARQFRVLAAVGLLLALAQGRAWGQEPVWERAANFVRRIRELPCILVRQPETAAQPPAPLFAWEERDAAEPDFVRGNILEASGDYRGAYFRYKALAQRYPARPAFATAAQRAKSKYEAAPDEFCCVGCWACSGKRAIDEGPLDWSVTDEPLVPSPQRKDMLPDSELTGVLTELGVIADQDHLLAIPTKEQPFTFWPALFH